MNIKNLNQSLSKMKEALEPMNEESPSETAQEINTEVQKYLKSLGAIVKPVHIGQDSTYKIAIPEVGHNDAKIKNLSLVKFIVYNYHGDFGLWAFPFKGTSLEKDAMKLNKVNNKGPKDVKKAMAMIKSYLGKVRKALPELEQEYQGDKYISIGETSTIGESSALFSYVKGAGKRRVFDSLPMTIDNLEQWETALSSLSDEEKKDKEVQKLLKEYDKSFAKIYEASKKILAHAGIRLK